MMRPHWIWIFCVSTLARPSSAGDVPRHTTIQTLVVEQYLKLCETVDICYINASKEFSRGRSSFEQSGSTYITPCCESCSCEEGCGKDCCPDMPELVYKLPDNPVTLEECIGANYRRDERLPYKPLYKMVTGCPPGYDKNEIREMCEKGRFNSSHQKGALVLLPVTVNETTYKNSMCATCNGEREEDFVIWDLEFACKATPPSMPITFPELVQIVEDTSNRCDFEYKQPLDSNPAILCEQVIDKCNVSGQWKVYDPFVEAACISYTSIYGQEYKNVHCYLCNGHSVDDVEMLCEYELPGTGYNSFVALLDFNQLEKKSDTVGAAVTLCPEKQVFDPIKGRCLNLTCGHGFVQRGDRCTTLYQSVDGSLVLGVTISLMVRDPLSRKKLSVGDLRNLLEETIANSTQKMNLRTCLVYSFVRFKTSIRKLILDMYASNRGIVLSDVDYIALDIKIVDDDPSNITRTVDLIEDFVKFDMNLSDLYVTFRSIPGYRFLDAVSYRSNRGDFERVMMDELRFGFDDYIALDSGYDENGTGIIPLIRSSTSRWGCWASYEIDFDTFCPKAELHRGEYNLSIDQMYIRIHGTDVVLRKELISLSEHGDTIRVCLYDFLKATDKRASNDADEVTHTPLTIITIICVSLSLLALLLTLLVYCVFPSLRTVPGLNNMGLILSLLVSYSLTLVNALTDISTIWLCRFVGITLHFALLSSFTWMFVCTLHMARVFATLTQRSASESKLKVFIHYVLFTEIFSCLVVIVTVLVSYLSSGGNSIGYKEDPCYVEPDKLVYNVAIPVGLVIVLNFAMFAYVIVTIIRLPDMRKNSGHERQNIAIFVKLSTLTGLTWIFGFVYQFTSIAVFAYAFTILNASQGIFIMFSFVLNRRVYDMMREKKKELSSVSKPIQTISTGQLSNIDDSKTNNEEK